MMKKLVYILLSVTLILALFYGCDATSTVRLTEEQEAHIDLIVQYRDKWKEVSEPAVSYPVNRVHIAQAGDGITMLTVAHVNAGTGSDKGWQTYVAQGYVADDGIFRAVDSYHKDWLADCVSVDLENMSDDELREVLRSSYKKYLSKK